MADFLLYTRFGYYFRMRVPADLRKRLGKREFKKPLQTSDICKARIRARLYAVEATKIFETLRGLPMAKSPFFYSPLMTVDSIIKHPDGTLEARGVNTDSSKPEEESILLRALIDRLDGVDTSFVKKPLEMKLEMPQETTNDQLQEPSYDPAKNQVILFSDAVRRYCDLKAKHWKPYYLTESLKALELVEEILGNPPIRTIDDPEAQHVHQVLLKLPRNRNKSPLYAGKTLAQILEMEPEDTLAPKTVNDIMTKLVSLFNWLRDRDIVKMNPFTELRVDNAKLPSEQRNMYTNEELTTLFQDPIFTAHQFKHSYMYWLPILGAYTGMRLNELCQLEVDDVKIVHDILVFHITSETSDKREKSNKSTKTPGSKRYVPVHPKIISLGFEIFVTECRTRNQKRLFPELPFFRDKYSHYASKWYARLRQKLGFGIGTDFHSFRHTFATILDRKKVKTRDIGKILGHTTGGITGTRYIKPSEVNVLRAIVVKFEIDFAIQNVKPWSGGQYVKSSAQVNVHTPNTKRATPVKVDDPKRESESLHANIFRRSLKKAREEV